MKYIKLWEKRAYPLHLMAMASQGATQGLAEKVFPESRITDIYSFWIDGYAEYIFEEEEVSKTVEAICEKGVKDPRFLYDVFRTAYAKSIELRTGSEKHRTQDISKVKLNDLISSLDQFQNEFYDFYAYGGVPTLLGYRDDNLIYKKAEDLLRRKLKNSPEKFAEYWTALTLPPKTTAKEDREMAILRIAEKAKKQGIKNNRDIAKKFKKEIGALMNDFGYLSFDFQDELLCNHDSWVEDVAKATKMDVARKIKELKGYEKNTEKEFRRICQELDFSTDDKEYFELIRNIGYYKWVREYEFMGALYNIKAVQDELGRRCDLSSLESKYILPSDLKNNFGDLANLKKLAQDRIACSISIAGRDGKINVYSGEEAKKIYNKLNFVKEDFKFQGNEIKGTPALAGKVTGKVKIVNFVRHIEKMEKGDILVSGATNPNLLPAMRKASAFITDEGGITCHAAIVARELQKPCITGTKIATKVLHDGDIVEVDADKGVVRILRK